VSLQIKPLLSPQLNGRSTEGLLTTTPLKAKHRELAAGCCSGFAGDVADCCLPPKALIELAVDEFCAEWALGSLSKQ
jgi:hypothetical protein